MRSGGEDVREQRKPDERKRAAEDHGAAHFLVQHPRGEQRTPDNVGVVDEGRASGAGLHDGKISNVDPEATGEASLDELALREEMAWPPLAPVNDRDDREADD